MNNIEKLRECPFCGNEDIVFANAAELEECDNFEQCECNYVTVICSLDRNGCGATSGYKPNEERTAALWNRRACDAEITALRKENEAAVKDLASLRGQSCPCHICEFVDMIRCCHDAQCSEKNLCFKWRGLPSAPTPPRTNFDALTENPERLAEVLIKHDFDGYCPELPECVEGREDGDYPTDECKQCLVDWLNGAVAENAEA